MGHESNLGDAGAQRSVADGYSRRGQLLALTVESAMSAL